MSPTTHGPTANTGDGGDADYLRRTLVHRPVELYFDESVTPRSLFLLWLRAALLTGPFFLISAVLFIFLALASGLAGAGGEEEGGGGGGTVLVFVIMILAFAAFWLILLLTRLQEPI